MRISEKKTHHPQKTHPLKNTSSKKTFAPFALCALSEKKHTSSPKTHHQKTPSKKPFAPFALCALSDKHNLQHILQTTLKKHLRALSEKQNIQPQSLQTTFPKNLRALSEKHASTKK
ncbi:MAG: hypothetical protein IPL12_17345 [Bacteroidetes bacterium]|nr:hypothetical protein [Bacteroidota bacterium]